MIYVVMRETGSYSDYSCTPECYFSSKEDAEEYVRGKDETREQLPVLLKQEQEKVYWAYSALEKLDPYTTFPVKSPEHSAARKVYFDAVAALYAKREELIGTTTEDVGWVVKEVPAGEVK